MHNNPLTKQKLLKKHKAYLISENGVRLPIHTALGSPIYGLIE